MMRKSFHCDDCLSLVFVFFESFFWTIFARYGVKFTSFAALICILFRT